MALVGDGNIVGKAPETASRDGRLLSCWWQEAKGAATYRAERACEPSRPCPPATKNTIRDLVEITARVGFDKDRG